MHLLVVIGLGAYFFIQNRKAKGPGQTPMQNGSPLDMLKRRYSRGEIEKGDYERMKMDIEE
jgi:putative membrane protein